MDRQISKMSSQITLKNDIVMDYNYKMKLVTNLIRGGYDLKYCDGNNKWQFNIKDKTHRLKLTLEFVEMDDIKFISLECMPIESEDKSEKLYSDLFYESRNNIYNFSHIANVIENIKV